MNYALNVANRVKAKLENIERSHKCSELDELQEYQKALAAVIEEDEGRTWVGGNIIVDDYILIIDSDRCMQKIAFWTL